MHQTFKNDAPPAADYAPAVVPQPEVVELPPPVRRRTPFVERYGAEIAEFFRKVIPIVFGLALFVVIWAIVSQNSTLPGPVKTWHSAVDCLYLSTRRLEAVRTQGRRPHVPSSNQPCQRATKTDAPSNPFFSGRPVRLDFGDRRVVPVRSTASVEWLLCVTFRPVNSLVKLSVFFSKQSPETAEIRGFLSIRPAPR